MEIKKIKNFYKNKKVFITGHTGFKGIWLYLILNYLGAKVLGYSLPLKKNDNFLFFKTIKKKINSEFGDILDYNNLYKCIKKFKPHIVFHLAAQSLVIDSQKFPKNTFNINIIGTNNVIDIVKKNKSTKSLVIATSDKCYLNDNKLKSFREDSILGGNEPYSASKAICEKLINLYLNKFKNEINFGLSSVRAGNVIGGGDFSNYRIIPDIIKNFSKRSITLRNPNSIRPWQYILDVCLAYIFIPIYHYKNKNKYSGPYNVGPLNKSSIKVKKISSLFIKFLKVNYKIKVKKKKYIESKYLFLNSMKINTMIKWKPYFKLKSSLKNTANWYLQYIKKRNLIKFTNSQIKDYFNCL